MSTRAKERGSEPDIAVILVAPISSPLRSKLTPMFEQSSHLSPAADQSPAQAPTTGGDPELPQMIVGQLPADTLEELSRLIERTSPVPILVFWEAETFRAASGREWRVALAGKDIPGSWAVANQISNMVLTAVRNANRPALGHQPPGRIRYEGLLSVRELEVLALLAEGASNKQISEGLAISPNTVQTHVRHIQRKLKTANRTQAALLAHASAIEEQALASLSRPDS